MVTKHEHATVVGVFDSRAQAERAVAELRCTGFPDDQIGIVTQSGETTGSGPALSEEETHTGEVVATGASAGGVLGGLLGAAASFLIPGIGPVLAGGILATTLSGAALGAVAGGLIGVLTGLGIPEEEAHYYEAEFRAGRTLVTVRTNGRHREAEDILRRFGAYDAHARREAAPRTESVIPPARTGAERTLEGEKEDPAPRRRAAGSQTAGPGWRGRDSQRGLGHGPAGGSPH